ncbi:hypothetical protein FIBSPDRAFT_959506 [Athelia psychrophila]|uniref:Uncharacterized protein n=1 Tax=Athelia psychrophila TaxID=1759441 RepID=A0A166DGL8_9AGAM|nr:hypothetical protein FIBSPDRAFT_959506 [Fibularhizoctonia sp. CBS 109695]
MNSFFSLKRSVRSAKSPKKAPKPKPSSGRALAAIPEIEEEDFFCRSASSSTSSLVFPSTSAYSHLPHLAAPRPRERTSSNSSIVDVARERLSAYEFSIDDTLLLEPRPAPSPPRTPSPVKSARRNSISSKHSSGFRMVLGPGGLEFPRPPSTAAQHSCPSPTSTCTSSGTDDLPVSPTDDEFAFQLQAMPYTRPLHIRKRLARRRMSPVSTTPELSECESSPSESEEDTSEVGEWYTQQFSGVFAAPLPSPSPYACAQVPESPSPFTRETARPDSVISIFPAFAPAQKIQGRRPLPAIPATLMPSAQLDPSFPRRKRTICPPPAPVSASPVPVMDVDFCLPVPERARSVSASTTMSTSTTSTQQESDPELDAILGLYPASAPFPCSPVSAQWAVFPPTPTAGSGWLTLDTDPDAQLRLPLSLPSTPMFPELETLGYEPQVVKRVPSNDSAFSFPPSPPRAPAALPTETQTEEHERQLRSRWSSSTLASLPPMHAHTPREKLRFYFSGLKLPLPSIPSSPATHHQAHSPLPYAADREERETREEKRVKRSTSRSSVSTNGSGASAESASSSGLKRKPIPLALLMNTTNNTR